MRDSNWDFASNAARWASNEIGVRDSNWDYGSNTARFSCNTATWTSNQVSLRDGNWDYGSNTARWASNFAMTLSNALVNWVLVNADPPSNGNQTTSYGTMTFNLLNSNVSYIDYTGNAKLVVNNQYLSNTARWASNAASWTSNVVGTSASDWDFASNAARWASNTSRWASNTATSSQWASNTAIWASNTAQWASNSGTGLNPKLNWSNILSNPLPTGNQAASYGKLTRNIYSDKTFYIDFTGTAYPLAPSWWDTRQNGSGTVHNVYIGSYVGSLGWPSQSGFEVDFKSSFDKAVNFGTHKIPPNDRVVVSEPNVLMIATSSVTRPAIEFVSQAEYEAGTNIPFAMIYANDVSSTYSPPNTSAKNAGYLSLTVKTFSGGQYTGGSLLRNAFTISPDNDGRVTLWGGTTGSYRFEVGVDSAAKPGSGQWAVTSDERVKEDIMVADIDMCYENIKKIPLKRFKWKYEHFDDEQIYDRRKLGWIAQDVEKVFKKAVRTNPNHPTVPDCKSLDADQLYACMYGAIQKLQQMVEAMQLRIDELEAKEANQS